MFKIFTTASILILSSSLAFAETASESTFSKAIREASTAGFIDPIFSQLLSFSYPKGFIPVLENKSENSYIAEFVPEGQTRQAWSEMVTVTSAKGVAEYPKAAPDVVAESFAANFHKDCPESFSAGGLGKIKLSGYDAYAALISCGTSQPSGTPYSESTLFIIIKGEKDLYTIQWAERGAASKTPLTLDQAKWTARLKSLNPIKLCKIISNETAPYQSCIDQK